VVDALADHFQLATATLESEDDLEPGDSLSVWVLLCRELEPLTANLILETAKEPQPKRILWTDDRSNLVEVLRLLEPEEEEEEDKDVEKVEEDEPMDESVEAVKPEADDPQ
jgi:hypothetical protein